MLNSNSFTFIVVINIFFSIYSRRSFQYFALLYILKSSGAAALKVPRTARITLSYFMKLSRSGPILSWILRPWLTGSLFPLLSNKSIQSKRSRLTSPPISESRSFDEITPTLSLENGHWSSLQKINNSSTFFIIAKWYKKLKLQRPLILNALSRFTLSSEVRLVFNLAAETLAAQTFRSLAPHQIVHMVLRWFWCKT